MRLKFMTLLCVIAILCAGSVFSAVTGKITGEITDASTKEPIIGVTVAVQGTTLGAITDLDGRYIVLNVPVGTYTLVVSAVGYATVEVSNVQVSADLATYQNLEMTTEATELGKTIQVVAETPMIVKDKTTTVDVVKRDELLAMPVRGFEQVVGIQNSVVRMNSNVDIRQRGQRESVGTAPEINLRGGRPSEVAYYVDGFSQQDPLTGLSTANINNNAIQEVSVTSGAFSAEYGHVASGIVNVTTNSGTDEYHGNIEVVSDAPTNEIGLEGFDQNYYSADIGGPIPGMKEKGTFFLSGERRWLRDRSPSAVTEEVYTKFGIDEVYDMDNPWRLPNNSLSGWSYQGKIDLELSPNMKLGFSGNGSLDEWQEYQHFYMHPTETVQIKHTPRYRDENLGLNAKLTHTLNANTFYNLSVSFFETQRKRGDGVLFDDYSDTNLYVRGFANPEFDVYNLYKEGNFILDDDDNIIGYAPSFYDDYLDRRSSYIGTKGDITSQVTSHHTLKAGFDFQRHTLRYFRDYTPTSTAGYSTSNINRYGFDSTANVDDPSNFENETKHPINLGLYIQDRFEWRNLIINAGVRFDYFDYKALRLKDITHPYGTSGDEVIDREDVTDSKKFSRVSPRFGISFPVSDRTKMHINYGKFFQRPDLNKLFIGYDFMDARFGAGSYLPFANPNLEPEKVTQYEVGINHQLGDNTAFGITAYYKDVEDLTQIFHQDFAVPFAYDFYGNVDFGTIKGIDFDLAMRRTRNMSMNLKYSLSYANGTGSYANSTYNVAWKNPQGTPKSTNPLDFDQRHSIIFMFDLRTNRGEGPRMGNAHPLENFGLNVIIQAASGLPYTPTRIYDGVTPNASVNATPTGGINSATMPWTFTIDLKLERKLQFGSYSLVPYVWVRNLLDRDNVLSVYEGTGKAEVSGYLNSAEGQLKATDPDTGAEYSYRYDLLQNNPKNYSNPRMVLFGLRLSF